MPRKVFISFLGTSSYKECRYSMEGVPSMPVKFVQEAIINFLCKNWTSEDHIFIFCTSKETTGKLGSKEINWINRANPDGSVEKGLYSRLLKLHLQAQIEEIDIKSGFTESDVWDMFTTVYDKLMPGDAIYFDVTHAFRSIPLFSVVMFNYARFMIDTHLEKIMYGAFDALGSAREVDKIPIDERIAPIIDMSSIVRLQEYNQLASELVTFGRVKSISDSLYYKNKEASEDLCCLCDAIDELDEYISTIQLEHLQKGDYVRKFHKYLQRMRDSGEIARANHPILRILDKLENEMKLFVPQNDVLNIEAAIEWANKHEMVLQEYPLAEEYIIYRTAYIFEKDRIEYRISEQDIIEIFRSILGMSDKKLDNMSLEEKIFRKDNRFVNFVEQKFPRNSLNANFIKDLKNNGYTALRIRRNSLAHADGKYSYQDLSENLLKYYNKCMETINYFENR